MLFQQLIKRRKGEKICLKIRCSLHPCIRITWQSPKMDEEGSVNLDWNVSLRKLNFFNSRLVRAKLMFECFEFPSRLGSSFFLTTIKAFNLIGCWYWTWFDSTVCQEKVLFDVGTQSTIYCVITRTILKLFACLFISCAYLLPFRF